MVTSIVFHTPSFWMVVRIVHASLEEKTGQLFVEMTKAPLRQQWAAFDVKAMQEVSEFGDTSLMWVRWSDSSSMHWNPKC